MTQITLCGGPLDGLVQNIPRPPDSIYMPCEPLEFGPPGTAPVGRVLLYQVVPRASVKRKTPADGLAYAYRGRTRWALA